MHCASLGEFEQGRPVLERLKNEFPSYKIVLTFFSPSGYEVRKNYPGADLVLYLPMDGRNNARKFISKFNPALVIWVKYEYWYYYLTELKAQNIPVLLVSGIFRSSQPFFKWYGGIWKVMLKSFKQLFVQTQFSKDLLQEAGISENLTVSGDTRFDRVIDIAEKSDFSEKGLSDFCRDSRVVVAGSTWEEDEAEWIHYVKAHPATKFIIAPHEVDVENIKDVQTEFTGSVLYSNCVSEQWQLPPDAHVVIIDNIGMLSKLYKYATITYVGGGFGDSGIHNVLEAAVYGKPVIFGPEYEKFEEAKGLVACGGAFSINSAVELEALLNELETDQQKLQASGNAAKEYVYQHRGATSAILNYIHANRLLTN
jgi:3-deoxy-D-manno-octulosonic-acid transferase